MSASSHRPATLVIAKNTKLPGLITGFTGPLDVIILAALTDSSNQAANSFDATTDLLTVTGGGQPGQTCLRSAST